MNQHYTFLPKKFSLVLFLTYLFLLSGCGMRFYKANLIKPENKLEKINLAITANKYFIIHLGEKQSHLEDPTTIQENGQVYIKGKLSIVGNLEAEMSERLHRNNFAYSSRFGKYNIASHQIHLYALDSEINENEFSVPFSSITKIVNYNTAPAATLLSHVFMTLIIPSTLIAFIFR